LLKKKQFKVQFRLSNYFSIKFISNKLLFNSIEFLTGVRFILVDPNYKVKKFKHKK